MSRFVSVQINLSAAGNGVSIYSQSDDAITKGVVLSAVNVQDFSNLALWINCSATAAYQVIVQAAPTKNGPWSRLAIDGTSTIITVPSATVAAAGMNQMLPQGLYNNVFDRVAWLRVCICATVAITASMLSFNLTGRKYY